MSVRQVERPPPVEVVDGLDRDGDTLREECGVFGIFGHPDASAIVALGLHALQHRGQEAAGIVSFDGAVFHSERRPGLVGDSFSDRSTIEHLEGPAAIGHVRYSTTGGTILRNVQPLFAELASGGLAVAHNGNLTNALSIRRDLVRDGAITQSTSDTEVILHLAARSRAPRIVERFIEALRQIEGAYAIVALTNKKLIGARDPHGHPPPGARRARRPLHPGLRDLRPRHHRRQVHPRHRERRDRGDLGRGHRVDPLRPGAADAPVHLRVHLLRPAGFGGERQERLRRAQEHRPRARPGIARPTADVVIPVPDSGVPAALGFAQETGLPFEMGIIRNHYVGRTFIQPTQSVRELGVRMKHSANRAVVEGKRIVLVDDSLVRGTTSVKIVRMMREAGAREVHFRIASPPITYPDFYGIDTPEREKLLAATHDLEGMRRYIGADSLAFLSIDGLYKAMGEERRDEACPQYTDHCFTGDYPTGLTDLAIAGPRRLAMLAEAD